MHCSEFEDGFDGENCHEEVVDSVRSYVDYFTLTIPHEAENNSIADDADHDEKFKSFVQHHFDCPVSDLWKILWSC